MWYALAMSCTISGTLPRLSLGAFDNKTTCMLKKVKTTQNNEKMNNSRSHYGCIPDNRTTDACSGECNCCCAGPIPAAAALESPLPETKITGF